MRLFWILILVILGVTAGYLFTLFESDAPEIRTRTQSAYVSDEYRHEFRVSDQGQGLKEVTISLHSGDQDYELEAQAYPGSPFTGAELNIQRRIEAVVRPPLLGLSDGPATLRARATDYSWRENATVVEIPLIVDTRPPRISLETGLTYVRRGGTELVVYSVDEEVERDGVVLGEEFFPGYPHPGDPKRRVAFYALPPQTPPRTAPSLLAEDRAGNELSIAVRMEVIERSFRNDTIQLDEPFMAAKVAEIKGANPTDVLAAYLEINRDLRAENAATIREICANSSDDRLWSGPFLQLPNSNVGAGFADSRTYRYAGRDVDRQVHLGFDLASTARAEVPAANDGVVAFAGELGIYGRTVILDHGLGLFSLYGHLSEIGVEKGGAVARGEALGRTGTTGLAGGDHLHYAMLVSGVFVDPLEWFDEKWIQEHIEAKLRLEEPEA